MNHPGAVSVRPLSIRQEGVLTQAMWITLFAVLTAVGAQVEIPHQPVPYTLQTFFVLLSGALLGKKNGALSQVSYLFLGAIGVPVFSGWGFGLARLVGPTGGYLLSFPVAAFVVGYLVRKEAGLLWSILSMAIGLLIVFSLGTMQLNLLYIHDWSQAMKSGFLIFSWWDGVKLIAAAVICRRLARRSPRS
jgi:biotin transport system substrate-specific component